MGPYADFNAVLWGIIANAGLFLFLVGLRGRYLSRALSRLNGNEDSIPKKISPSVAWMVMRKAANSLPMGTGPLNLALARMERRGYLSVEKNADGFVLNRTNRRLSKCKLFPEEQAFGETLFDGDKSIPVAASHHADLTEAYLAYNSSITAQCVGRLYGHSLAGMWFAALYALTVGIVCGSILPPSTDTAYLGIVAVPIVCIVVPPWIAGKKIGPRRIAGAFATLAAITILHGVAAAHYIGDQAAYDRFQSYWGEDANLDRLFDPIFLTCLWLTGMAMISWEWLKVYTPTGTALVDRMNRERALFEESGEIPGTSHPAVIDWGGPGFKSKRGKAGSAAQAVEQLDPKMYFPDWEGVMHGTVFGLRNAWDENSTASYGIAGAIEDVTFIDESDIDGGGDGGD